MNDRQLRSFISAADEKSFSKAAAASYISPPALISQINILEKDLGFPLFTRGTHGIELNAQGRSFYNAAKEILRIYDESCERCLKELNSEESIIRIFSSRFDSIRDFVRFCYQYRKDHPDMEVQLRTNCPKEPAEALKEGLVDLIVGPEVKDETEELIFYPIARDPICFLAAEDDPWTAKEQIRKEDLKERTICAVVPAGQSETTSLLLGDCSNVRMISESEAGNVMDLVLGCVLEGQVVMLPESMCGPLPAPVTAVKSDLFTGMVGITARKNSGSTVNEFIREVVASRR